MKSLLRVLRLTVVEGKLARLSRSVEGADFFSQGAFARQIRGSLVISLLGRLSLGGSLCLCLCLSLLACSVTPPQAAKAPPPWVESGYRPWGQEESSTVIARAAPPREPEAQRTPVARRAPSGDCLTRLRGLGVEFQELPSLKGVETPVRVEGKLAGVEFFSNHGRKLDMDCRLAVALVELGGEFRSLGITKARFSGAYVYRTTRKGRLSHHAFGLAIDIHEIWVGSQRHSVDKAFRKGNGCDRKGPVLNTLACTFKASGLFEEVLTPDYNWDHRDHLHVAVPKVPPSSTRSAFDERSSPPESSARIAER